MPFLKLKKKKFSYVSLLSEDKRNKIRTAGAAREILQHVKPTLPATLYSTIGSFFDPSMPAQLNAVNKATNMTSQTFETSKEFKFKL